MEHHYKNMKKDPYEKEKPPRDQHPLPTDNEYKVGMYTRYFIRRINDHNDIVEVDEKQFGTLTEREKGINNSLYEGIRIKWRIRGKRHDEYTNGIRTYPGVEESNARLLEPLLKTWPTLSRLLRDMSEHARIEIAEASTVLTTNVEDHFHYVFIDNNGNGHTSEYTNPKNPNITHYHKVEQYVIQEAQDSCYPDCIALYGEPGKIPHTHEIKE